MRSYRTTATCASDEFAVGADCYEMIDEPLPWIEASMRAVAMGGYLASFKSEKEYRQVLEQMESRGLVGSGFWTGMFDIRKEGNMENVDGTSVQFARWKTGQPND